MSEKLICNICIEPIEENSNDSILIRLKCVPDKHYFCRKCIIDWYKEIQENSKKGTIIDYKSRMCPLCRDDGGYIELLKDEKFIKGIHKKKEVEKKMKIKNENKEQCKFILTNKKQCSRNSCNNCDGHCSQHFAILNKKKVKIIKLDEEKIDEQKLDKIELTELEQFEEGFKEVNKIYEDYYEMWINYDNNQKMNERIKLYEIMEMLKEQILVLLNVISMMMDDNKNNNELIIKLMDDQFKTLKLEEKINILENEMILYDVNNNIFINNYEENNLSKIFNDFNIEMNQDKEEENYFDNFKVTFFNENVSTDDISLANLSIPFESKKDDVSLTYFSGSLVELTKKDEKKNKNKNKKLK